VFKSVLYQPPIIIIQKEKKLLKSPSSCLLSRLKNKRENLCFFCLWICSFLWMLSKKASTKKKKNRTTTIKTSFFFYSLCFLLFVHPTSTTFIQRMILRTPCLFRKHFELCWIVSGILKLFYGITISTTNFLI